MKKNTSKITTIVIILAVLAVAGIYFYSRTAKAPTLENSQNSAVPTVSATPPQSTTTSNSNGVKSAKPTPTLSNQGENLGSNIQVVEVDYDGSKFIPQTSNINVNDWVFFKNKSTVSFWPLSSGNVYLAFNADKAVLPAGEFKFQFTKTGTWQFNDKLNPSATGTIIVK